MNGFRNFLLSLGFSKEELRNESDGAFVYDIERNNIAVNYFHTPTLNDIFRQHQILWNKNLDPVFIAIGNERSHLINVKEKPDRNNPLKPSICIKTFDYGVNSAGFEDLDPILISKINVDSAYFFDFVNKHQRVKRSVDKDLLLNLLTLKSDLLNGSNSQTIHILILRCLFIKYLEDRGIFTEGYLLTKLQSGNPELLFDAFDQVAKINGDVFKYDAQFSISDVLSEYLEKLALFFNCDYRSGQQYLFPYKFDHIPIQLVSHVYEAFLKTSTKKGDGIYYTPDFLVDFMLKQSFAKELEKNPDATILDPAVGSGAFLVQAFRMIEQAKGERLGFEEKKAVLRNQLFGIDKDRDALQISAFSLYLALLDNEDPEFIKQEIERANPILPSLIGESLVCANSLLDHPFQGKAFDCIVSNPPWGSVPTDSDDLKAKLEYEQEREAIDNKTGKYPEYKFVAGYERSQAFLSRVGHWGNEDSTYVMVVKNSIFLNDKSCDFRKDVLGKYDIEYFYELSHYNKILFKKSVLGQINGEKIELGASEPCAVLVFKHHKSAEHILHYVSPKLTEFAEQFEVIHYTSSDQFALKQGEFQKQDTLWKVLVNADIDAHDLLVEKVRNQSELVIEAKSGFQPKSEMKSLGKPIFKRLIEPSDFAQFHLLQPNLPFFDWNKDLRRKPIEEIFIGPRVLLPVRPLKSDKYLMRGVYVEEEIIHKHNLLSIKLKDRGSYVENYLPYLGILNSQLIGFLFFNLSSQWGKGEGKRDTLRNIDVERLPIKRFSEKTVKDKMTKLVQTIQDKKAKNMDCQAEIDQINETVFDLYELVDYEKEIIREFFDVRVNRSGKRESLVRPADMSAYFDSFKSAFSLLLAGDKTLNATFEISSNIGAVICFAIVEKSDESVLERNATLNLLRFVKQNQLSKADALKVLFEEKVKIYDKDSGAFFIIKSNRFKDWTVRQAMKDAKEEVDAFMEFLPTK